MAGWSEYLLAFATFLVLHAVPVRPPVRQALVARLGQRGFTAGYSAVSLLALGWLIGAAGRAPYVELWEVAPWQAWVPLVVMLPVCLVLALAIGRPNPFSFGGARAADFDPGRPGIVRLHRHPLLLALALWAAAHVVPNGDLAHVGLFGVFAAFALIGGRMIDRRKRREMGGAWARTLARAGAAPLSAALAPPGPTAVRLALGVAAYVALLHLHPLLFGVSPLP